jgi:hypothetical protein
MDPHPARPPSLLDPQLLWAMVALITTLLLGAVIFAWLDRWRKRGDRDRLTPTDQLTAFRQSYERGELSQEEYQRIRAKLAPKLRQQVNLPPRPASEATGRRVPPESPVENQGPDGPGSPDANSTE